MTAGLEEGLRRLVSWAAAGAVVTTAVVVYFRFSSRVSWQARKHGPLPESLPFMRRRLVSNAESEALRFIRAAQPGLHVNVATRLVDVVTPVRGLTRSERQRARNMVRAMHLDFVLCDAHMNPLLALELDDSSHDSPAARRRDEIKNKAVVAAGIPLVRIHVRDLSQAEVSRRIRSHL